MTLQRDQVLPREEELDTRARIVRVAETLLPASQVLDASDTMLVLAISDPDEVPNIVARLAQGGARILSVLLERENIEETFLRLCSEGT
jgi:hypothetical protein